MIPELLIRHVLTDDRVNLYDSIFRVRLENDLKVAEKFVITRLYKEVMYRIMDTTAVLLR